MRGLNLKEIMSKSNMNQQGLNIATYGQAYKLLPGVSHNAILASWRVEHDCKISCPASLPADGYRAVV